MRYLLVTIVVLIVNAVVMTAVYFYVSHQIRSNDRQVLQLQQEFNQFGDSKVRASSMLSSDEALIAKEQLIQQLKTKQGFEPQLLSTVSLGIPKEVWLTEWIQTENSVVLKGYAISNDVLASFINTLSENSIFKTVSLSSTLLKKINDMNVYQFNLLCELAGGSDD